MNAREKKVTPFVNIFSKVLKLQVAHWILQEGHSVTRESVVRHLCHKPSLKCYNNREYCSYNFLKEGAEGGLKVPMGEAEKIYERLQPPSVNAMAT